MRNDSIGKTPLGEARSFYPRLIKGQDAFNAAQTADSRFNFSMKQHAVVSQAEQFGMNKICYRIVDVTQKLNVNFDKGSGNLSANTYTNVFPSATLKLNNANMELKNYKQSSFVGTYTAPITGFSPLAIEEGRTGGQPIRNFSYYPSQFYKRNSDVQTKIFKYSSLYIH